MFCSKCGHELREDEKFCTQCGARTGDFAEQDIQDTSFMETKAGTLDDAKEDIQMQKQSISDEASEYSTFDRIAIKFGDVLDILLGIVFLILSLVLFSEGAVVLGVLFLVCALATIIGGTVSLFSRAKKNEYTGEDIKKKKRNMVIALIVFVVVIVIIVI